MKQFEHCVVIWDVGYHLFPPDREIRRLICLRDEVQFNGVQHERDRIPTTNSQMNRVLCALIVHELVPTAIRLAGLLAPLVMYRRIWIHCHL